MHKEKNMNTNLELENIVDEMIQEGILDRVEARAAGMFAGAKQMGQNVKGVFTGAPTKGYGQQYGEVKFNNRINQFLKQAQKDLAEFEAKYGADLSKTKMSEDAKATAIAQIAEIKKAIATAQERAGGTKAPAAQQAQNQQTPPSAGSEAGSTTTTTGTPAPQSAVPSPAGQSSTQQQAGGTPATAKPQGRAAVTGSGKKLNIPQKRREVKTNPNAAASATSTPHDYGKDAEEAAKAGKILNASYSPRGPYSYLIEQPQQKASKADIDKQIVSMFAKIIQKLKAKPDDKELLGLLQKLSKTTDPKAQYQILSASKRLNEHLERIAEREAKLLEEGEFTDSLKANIAGAKAGIGAVRSNLRNFGKEGPNQNAMAQAKAAKEQALINAPINNLKTKIGKNLAELNRDLKTLGFNKVDDKRFEPIKQSLDTLQKTLSAQQFGEVKTKLGDIRHGIGTFVGGAIKNSVIGAGLAAAIASGGVTNPYAAKAIAGAATSVIRDISKGDFKKDNWKGILKRAAVGAGIGLAVQGIKDFVSGTGPFANSNAAEQAPSGGGVQQSGAGDVAQSGAGGEDAYFENSLKAEAEKEAIEQRQNDLLGRIGKNNPEVAKKLGFKVDADGDLASSGSKGMALARELDNDIQQYAKTNGVSYEDAMKQVVNPKSVAAKANEIANDKFYVDDVDRVGNVTQVRCRDVAQAGAGDVPSKDLLMGSLKSIRKAEMTVKGGIARNPEVGEIFGATVKRLGDGKIFMKGFDSYKMLNAVDKFAQENNMDPQLALRKVLADTDFARKVAGSMKDVAKAASSTVANAAERGSGVFGGDVDIPDDF